jgi:hypothetical protein
MKAGGKHSNPFAEISDYVGNGRGMVESNTVSVGSPIGQNELPVPIGSHTTMEQTNRRQEQDNQHCP